MKTEPEPCAFTNVPGILFNETFRVRNMDLTVIWGFLFGRFFIFFYFVFCFSFLFIFFFFKLFPSTRPHTLTPKY